jgi:hypothetical protein
MLTRSFEKLVMGIEDWIELALVAFSFSCVEPADFRTRYLGCLVDIKLKFIVFLHIFSNSYCDVLGRTRH